MHRPTHAAKPSNTDKSKLRKIANFSVSNSVLNGSDKWRPEFDRRIVAPTLPTGHREKMAFVISGFVFSIRPRAVYADSKLTGSVFMRKLCSQSNNHGNFSMLIMFNMCHFAVMSCKRLTNLMFYRVDFKTEKILEIYFFQFTDHVKIFDFDISLSPFIMCSNIKPNHCFIKTSTSHINLP